MEQHNKPLIKPNEFYLYEHFYDESTILSDKGDDYIVSVNKDAKTLDIHLKFNSERFFSIPLNSVTIKIRELDEILISRKDGYFSERGFTHQILFNAVIVYEDGESNVQELDFIEKTIGVFKLDVNVDEYEEDKDAKNAKVREIYKYIIADVRKFLNEI